MTAIFTKSHTYENGLEFRQEELSNYFIDYIETKNKNHLIIVFDGSHVDESEPAQKRLPWGAMFFNYEGFSLVGVKVKKPDWYRGADIHDFFTSEAFQTFIKQYETVCLYGNSMGGFAALAFAGAIEGARILATGPQSTLDPRVASWDNRYPHGTQQNWDGRFADASKTLDKIEKAYIIHDPFYEIDRKHAKRLPKEKTVHLKAPFIQHDLAPQLLEMDLLKDLFLHFIKGDLEHWFPKAIRARKQTNRYKYHALLFWGFRYYERENHRRAQEIFETLVAKHPSDPLATKILHGIKTGQKINWKWQE